MSHPFVERLIRTIRREYLDRTLFWTAIDLESKVIGVYGSLQAPSRSRVVGWETPEQNSESERQASLVSYAWREHCRVSHANSPMITNSPCTRKNTA